MVKIKKCTYTPNTLTKITLERVNMKKSDASFFKKQAPYFTNPHLFMGKPPTSFCKNFENSLPSLL